MALLSQNLIYAPALLGQNWFNAPRPSGSQNGVRLILFWTADNPDWPVVLPLVRSWWERYRDMGLEVVGVYTPRYKFELDPVVLERHLKQADIGWPVLFDRHGDNQTNFFHHTESALYLVEPDGLIAKVNFDGQLAPDFEAAIQQAVGATAGGMTPIHRHSADCIPGRVWECGYESGPYRARQLHNLNRLGHYRQEENRAETVMELTGQCLLKATSVTLFGPKGVMTIQCDAATARVILEPRAKSSVMRVKLNDKIPPASKLGRDLDTDGQIKLTTAGHYELLVANRLGGRLSLQVTVGCVEVHTAIFAC